MVTLPPLSEEQFQALAGLIDAGVRHSGIRAVKDAAAIVEWMEKTSRAESEKEDPR